jgi:hypothetical protein
MRSCRRRAFPGTCSKGAGCDWPGRAVAVKLQRSKVRLAFLCVPSLA